MYLTQDNEGPPSCYGWMSPMSPILLLTKRHISKDYTHYARSPQILRHRQAAGVPLDHHGEDRHADDPPRLAHSLLHLLPPHPARMVNIYRYVPLLQSEKTATMLHVMLPMKVHNSWEHPVQGRQSRGVPVHRELHLRHRVLQPHLLAARPYHDHPLLQNIFRGQKTFEKYARPTVQSSGGLLHLRPAQHVQHWDGDAEHVHAQGGHVLVLQWEWQVRGRKEGGGGRSETVGLCAVQPSHGDSETKKKTFSQPMQT